MTNIKTEKLREQAAAVAALGVTELANLMLGSARVIELLYKAISASFPKGQKVQLTPEAFCEVIDVGEIVGWRAATDGVRIAVYGCCCGVTDYRVSELRLIGEDEYTQLCESAGERLKFTWTPAVTLGPRDGDGTDGT